MNQSDFNQGLFDFIQASPTPFHAVSTMCSMLEAAGYSELQEEAPWTIEKGGLYFVCRNSSSIIAFRAGEENPVESGIHLAGAHTDSPCLKVKPNPEMSAKGYVQLGVEVYGGVLMHPWFDRDLSIAGRVSFKDNNGNLGSTLVDFQRPVAIIPSLAIHLDREANTEHSINAQKHLPPLLMSDGSDDSFDFRALLVNELATGGIMTSQVLDYDLCLYDVQPPAITGLKGEFMAAARLDNLLSCYIGVQSLLSSASAKTAVLVCNDHEEVGSSSTAGAQGTFLQSVLERICEQLGNGEFKQQNFRRMLSHSTMISMDNAHGVHPNFADMHDPGHGPLLNKGPVIKINANQRYATNSETSAWFRSLAAEVDEPVQAFVVRSDMGCGSTIGPIVATELGLDTVDIGVPTFAMHSIRECAGSGDALSLHNIMQAYWS